MRNWCRWPELDKQRPYLQINSLYMAIRKLGFYLRFSHTPANVSITELKSSGQGTSLNKRQLWTDIKHNVPEIQQSEPGPANLSQSVLKNIGYNGLLLWWSRTIQLICHIFYVAHELTCYCNAIDNLYRSLRENMQRHCSFNIRIEKRKILRNGSFKYNS